jgi:hypothetical protein
LHFVIFIHNHCPISCDGYSFISHGLMGNLSLMTRQFERLSAEKM